MALTQTQNLPAPFIQGLGEEYATGLSTLTRAAMPTSQYAPTVVGQDPLQTQAATLAGQAFDPATGLGAYAPYIGGAQQAMGFDPSQGQITAQGYQAALQPFETPYQADVLSATLANFDQTRFAQEQAIRDKAVEYGSLGAGRTGVQLGTYQAQTARDRALLEAGIKQQGFQQAQQAAGTAYNQLTGLPGTEQSLRQQGIATLGQVGATQQAQAQAERDVMREANRMAAYEPYERLGFLGQGLTGLMGGYPQQYQFQAQPNPSPLASALGIGTTMGGILGNIYGNK